MTSGCSNRRTLKTVVADDFKSHADFISALPDAFADGQGEIIYDQRNQIRRFTDRGQVFVVKRYKPVNALQRVVYTFFRKTKAARAYLFAQEFRRRGIDTPREVAYIETGSGRLFLTGYFVSLEAPGTELHLLLREVKDFSHELADATARQILTMHSHGVLHGDLNLSNFLCTEHDGQYHFTMIDINRSHFTDGMPDDETCLQNMVRTTHRRDLYEYLVRSYARLRQWDEQQTADRALRLLEKFENRKIKL